MMAMKSRQSEYDIRRIARPVLDTEIYSNSVTPIVSRKTVHLTVDRNDSDPNSDERTPPRERNVLRMMLRVRRGSG